MSERYSFIDAEYADVPVEVADTAPTVVQMCGWLGVSKSGYYEWKAPAAERGRGKTRAAENKDQGAVRGQ